MIYGFNFTASVIISRLTEFTRRDLLGYARKGRKRPDDIRPITEACYILILKMVLGGGTLPLRWIKQLDQRLPNDHRDTLTK